jgi:glycosyltransferase involved in cell wall biosynthesis
VNIGLTNEYFWPFSAGGAEWSLLHLARELATRGHRPSIITPNYGAASFEEVDGVRVHRFPFPARMKRDQKVMRFRWLANPAFYLWFAIQARHVTLREQIEVLHAQNKYALPGTWLAARSLNLPVLLTIRDTSLLCPAGMCLHRYDQRPDGCKHSDFRSECKPEYIARYLSPRTRLSALRFHLTLEWLWWDTAVRRALAHRTDGIVGVSRGILEVYARWGMDVRNQARVIYNVPPVPTEVSSEEMAHLKRELDVQDQHVVLFVGQATPGKGVPDLIEASIHVVERVPDTQFLFVGQSSLRGQGQHVRALGVLPNAQVLRLYRIADAVVVPSVCQDALSRVVLEAMASGTPVVATSVGGTPEMVVDGVTGRLVPRHAPDELAEAIIQVITQSAEARAQWSRAAKRAIQSRFDADKSIEALIAFYRDAIQARRQR